MPERRSTRRATSGFSCCQRRRAGDPPRRPSSASRPVRSCRSCSASRRNSSSGCPGGGDGRAAAGPAASRTVRVPASRPATASPESAASSAASSACSRSAVAALQRSAVSSSEAPPSSRPTMSRSSPSRRPSSMIRRGASATRGGLPDSDSTSAAISCTSWDHGMFSRRDTSLRVIMRAHRARALVSASRSNPRTRASRNVSRNGYACSSAYTVVRGPMRMSCARLMGEHPLARGGATARASARRRPRCRSCCRRRHVVGPRPAVVSCRSRPLPSHRATP